MKADCEDDTAAAVKLEILLAERPICAAAELWDGRRLVHRVSRPEVTCKPSMHSQDD
jgi:hypothetical protein